MLKNVIKEEWVKHISESKKGKIFSLEHRDKLSKAQKGVKRLRGKMKAQSLEHRIKISESRKGNKHWNWQNGKTNESRVARNSIEYKNWRKAVFERDDYTCQICRIRGTYLEADHIKPFAKFIELRYELSNGRTLCKPCHMKQPTHAGRLNKNNQYTKNKNLLENNLITPHE